MKKIILVLTILSLGLLASCSSGCCGSSGCSKTSQTEEK